MASLRLGASGGTLHPFTPTLSTTSSPSTTPTRVTAGDRDDRTRRGLLSSREIPVCLPSNNQRRGYPSQHGVRMVRNEASIPGPMYMAMEDDGDENRRKQAGLFSKFPTRPVASSSSSIDPPPSMVRVCLSVDYRVHSRQMLCVGGSAIPLGWSFLSIAKVPMSWEPEDRWVVEFELPMGSKLEYKFVILEEQDWTQQMNAATEGMVEYSYRVQPEVNPPDVQKITRRMAIVAWQSGGNRVIHVPSKEEVLSVLEAGEDGLWREFDGKLGGAGAAWNAGARHGSDVRSKERELCWECLSVDDNGQPFLDRRDVWGIDGTSPFR